MKKINLKIDGRTIQADEGQTIFQAAQENGINIPHLCYDPRLAPFTSCWLCVVEVKGFPRLVPSCTARAAEDLDVLTDSERVRSARGLCLDLLLSDHYGDCIAPCQKACPDHIDIQGYLALIALGKYKEALELIREVNPLPLCVGRVCPRFCERECRRNLVDEPVGINYLKRFASEKGYGGIAPSKAVPDNTGSSVAIIGAGPAGLTAAHFLRLKGHAVTIFDSAPKPGGMMRYGIPEYRLPKREMDKEIGLILGMGVDVLYGVRFGKDLHIKDLRTKGFSATLLTIGAWAERRLGCDGEDLEGVESGIGFLYKIASGEDVTAGKRVAVIGGGNTAIDAARNCLRLGSEEVHLIYRRSRQEMPALDEEVHEAETEGVRFHFLSAPVKVRGARGKVDAIDCIRMELGEADASGRRSPVPVPGSEYVFKTDMVVAAIGQFMGEKDVLGAAGIRCTRRGIAADSETLETSLEGVFAAGDCVTGPATVIEAIAAGRKAAGSIDSYLKEAKAKRAERGVYNHSKGDLETIDRKPFEAYEKVPRSSQPALSIQERLKGFAEVEGCLSTEAAQLEAQRCLSCGCEALFDCKLREYATQYRITEAGIQQGKQNRYLPRDEHPFILRQRDKCIRCGICVRICSEIEGASALGFVGRGFQTIIDPPLDMVLKDSSCDSCGLCLSGCPTGALEYKPRLKKTGPWLPQTIESICTLCGIGCEVTVKTRAGLCLEVIPRPGGGLNQGKLCWKGSFGWEMIHAEKRLPCPYKKGKNTVMPVEWEEGIRDAGVALKGIMGAHGPESIAIVATARLSMQGMESIHKLAEQLRSHAPYIPNYSGARGPSIGAQCIGDYGELSESDLLVCIGSGIVEDYPVVSYMIKEAVKGGCKLAIIGREERRLSDKADIWIDCPPKEQGRVLSLLSAVAIREGIVTFAADTDSNAIETLNPDDENRLNLLVKKGNLAAFTDSLFRAKRPVVIVNTRYATGDALAWLCEGIWNKGGQSPVKSKFLFLSDYGRILREVGTCTGALEESIENGRVKALIVYGHWKALELINRRHPEVMVVQSAVFKPDSGYMPDFLFPANLPIEAGGGFINNEGRILELSEAITPPAGVRDWEFIARLAKALDSPLAFEGIQETVPALQGPEEMKDIEGLLNISEQKSKKTNYDWSLDEIDLYLKNEIGSKLYREEKP